MPFLPLYVEQLGVTGHSALNMWSGIVFSITFLFSAIASPFWGGLADRKGLKTHAITLCPRHGHRNGVDGTGTKYLAVFDPDGRFLGYLADLSPTLMLLSPHKYTNKSGWAPGTLSTGGVSGALLGPMAGGLLADSYGLRPVFFITASVLIPCFLSPCSASEKNSSRSAKKRCCTCGKW